MPIPHISPDEARRLMDQKGALLVDIRALDEHARERIAGAQCCPSGEQGIASDADVLVFHCRSGMRTSAMAGTLKAAADGRECYILDGGIEAWKRAGHGTQIDHKAPIDLMRQVQIAAGTLVLLGVLGSLFVHPALLGVAGFVGAGLTFAGISGFCGMARLLALMPWNRRLATG